jgi:hypothetical protein
MKTFLVYLLVFLIPVTSFGDAVIFSGNDVKTLKSNIDLFGQAKILSGTVNPTTTATSAPVGSIYLNTSNSQMYRKLDAGSTTNWVQTAVSDLNNLLTDGSFEGVSLNSLWIPQGGTITPTVTTSDVVDGRRAVSFTSGAGTVSGNLLSQLVSVLPNGDGASAEVSAWFKTTSANLQLCLGQAGTNISCTAIPATGKWVPVAVGPVPMPTANANFFVSTTSPGAVTFAVDKAYLGLSQNLGSVAQANYVGGMYQDGAANCYGLASPSSANTFANMTYNTGCPNAWTTYGGVSAVSNNSSAAVFSNMPAGDYEVVLNGYFAMQVANKLCTFRISDGTNSFGNLSIYNSASIGGAGNLVARFSYSGPPTTRTFQAIASTEVAGGTCLLGNDNANRRIEWTFKRFPTQQEQVVRLNNQPVYAGKTWLNGNMTVGQGAAAPTARTVITNAAFATYTTFGAAVNDASQNIQVTSYLPIGDYEITATGLFRSEAPSGAANSGATCNWDIYDSTAAATAGGVIATAPDSTTATAAYNDLDVVTTYVKITTPTVKTYQLRVSKANGSNASNCRYFTQNSGDYLYNGSMMIRPLNQQVNIVVPGSVTSSSSGVERLERLRFGGATDPTNCTTGTCTVYSGNTLAATVTRTSAGVYQIAFAAPFSARPSCFCSSTIIGSARGNCQPGEGTTANSINVATVTNAGTVTDSYAEIMCLGPR